MPRFAKKVSRKAGLSPGTIVHIGEQKTDKVVITRVSYDADHFEEKKLAKAEESLPFPERPAVTWLNVDGLHRTDVIEKLGEVVGLHPLLLEDVVTTGQHPKMEDFRDYLFVTLKILHYDDTTGGVEAEQFSLVLGGSYVVTFREKESDIFRPVLERLQGGKGRLRSSGADYLAYALMDTAVDGYFAVLEKIGEQIESVEEDLVTHPTKRELQKIQVLKREMLFLRRSVWHLREVLSCLDRGESTLIQEPTRIYFKDVYDHVIQVIDTIETYREMLSGMLDIYLSSVSNRLNEVMKVLTIIATIFIPLTFVVGIYGMNFKYMPELEWPWGYPLIWGVMVTMALGMIAYFRRKKWF